MGLNNHKYHVEVCFRFMILELDWEYGTVICVCIEASTVFFLTSGATTLTLEAPETWEADTYLEVQGSYNQTIAIVINPLKDGRLYLSRGF